MFKKIKLLLDPVIALPVSTLLVLYIAFQKFDQCTKFQWLPALTYHNRCYSDIPPLYMKYQLFTHVFPFAYGSNSFEYPSGMAVIVHLLTYLTPGQTPQIVPYFHITLTFIAAFFILSVAFISLFPGSSPYFFIFAPATVYSLFVNWDLFAILPMLIALLLFLRGKYTSSSLLLSLATSIKFIPVFVLIPILYIFFRDKSFKQLMKYFSVFTLSWLVFNLPFAVRYPEGFAHFYLFNIHRAADWGSYWYASYLLNPSNPNLIPNVLSVIVIAIIGFIFIKLRKEIDITFLSLLSLGGITLLSHVYSPQYTIWLTALTALIPGVKKVLLPYLSWQVTELAYNLAVWARLANSVNASMGIGDKTYAYFIMLRVIIFLYFLCALYLAKKKEIKTSANNSTLDDAPSTENDK